MNNLFHFIFGLSENFNNKPFSYFHYLCIKSCYLTQNKPKILMHCIYEPANNKWWEKIKEFVEIIKYKNLPDIVYFCNKKKVWRIEHQSDIFRLLILKEYGGIYADVDTLFYKSFFPHFNKYDFVLGLEGLFNINENKMQINGLCNALIISNKESAFLNLWLENYLNNYDDYDWNKMSVRKPYELALENKNLIHIEPIDSFHKFDWNLIFYFENIIDGDINIYSKHLAESKVYHVLKNYSKNRILKENSLFSNMCKNINGLLNE